MPHQIFKSCVLAQICEGYENQVRETDDRIFPGKSTFFFSARQTVKGVFTFFLFRQETDIVLEVTSKCLQKVRELNEQRKVRKPIQQVITRKILSDILFPWKFLWPFFLQKLDEIEKLREEYVKVSNAPSASQMKPFSGDDEISALKSKLESLPLWPHYAQIYKDNQYDQTTFQAVEVRAREKMREILFAVKMSANFWRNFGYVIYCCCRLPCTQCWKTEMLTRLKLRNNFTKIVLPLIREKLPKKEKSKKTTLTLLWKLAWR